MIVIGKVRGNLFGTKKITKKNSELSSSSKRRVYLVPVPNSNQAQIRIGSFVTTNECSNRERVGFVGSYLGADFSSLLMRELRVKRGLTYSAYAVSSCGKNYGRNLMSTFSRNEVVGEALDVIRNIFSDIGAKKIDREYFNNSKRALTGGHPFRFESNQSYLDEILQLDHIGRPYSDLQEFINRVNQITIDDFHKSF